MRIVSATSEVNSQRVAICLFILFILAPAIVHAEYLIKTKDGTTFTWSEYTEEDGNYCTWKSSGKFCLPKHDISSIKEKEAGGTIIKRHSNESGDVYGGSRGRSRSYNRDGSETIYIKENASDADLRQMELEEYEKKQEAAKRKRERELERQVEKSRDYEEREKYRLERERSQQQYEAEKNMRDWKYRQNTR